MMKINRNTQGPRTTLILMTLTTLCLLYIISLTSTGNLGVECAPMTLTSGNSKNSKSNNNNNANKNTNNRLVRPGGLLSNLFRRQTPNSSSSSSSSSSSNDDEANEAMSQTEIDAQKFMDSLPNPGASNNQGPSSFRERVTDTFGLLRDGVGNQFRSLRDNFSETVEDLRDTWTNSQD